MSHKEASEWDVGFDRASEKHRFCLLDHTGREGGGAPRLGAVDGANTALSSSNEGTPHYTSRGVTTPL
jgi:hypothetical protein